MTPSTPLAFAPSGWPVLRLGFRPFYLLTALLACVSVPLWVLMFAGHAALPLPLPGLLWHGHEMLFGFAAGVVMGFLLTAVRAWTGLDTARGPLLGVYRPSTSKYVHPTGVQKKPAHPSREAGFSI